MLPSCFSLFLFLYMFLILFPCFYHNYKSFYNSVPLGIQKFIYFSQVGMSFVDYFTTSFSMSLIHPTMKGNLVYFISVNL